MPLYNYACRDCGHEWDENLRMDDRKIPLEQPCTECGSNNLYQVISAPKIVRDVGGGIKVDDGFREVISKVKSGHKINNIKDY